MASDFKMRIAKLKQMFFCLIALMMMPIGAATADEVVASSAIAIVVHKGRG